MKKDYLDAGAMADSADLVVLGAYYGSGEKGGLLSTLLLGVSDGKQWRTVVKCGNGMSDAEIAKYQKLWKEQMEPCKDYDSIDGCFQIDRKHVPDMMVKDVTKSQVFEIAGAEVSGDGLFDSFSRCAVVYVLQPPHRRRYFHQIPKVCATEG